MRSYKGLHCGGRKGGGIALVLIVAVVLVSAKIGHTVASAAATAGHALAVVLEVVLITVASAAGVAVLAALVWAGLRAYRWRAARRVPVPRAIVRAEIISPEPKAIDPSKLRINGIEHLLPADQVPVSRE